MKKLLVSIGLLSVILAVFLIFASENPTGASVGKDKFAAPDLIISVWASKTSPSPTDTINIFIKAKNRGRAASEYAGAQLLDTTGLDENLCLMPREKIAGLLAEPANKEKLREWNLDFPQLNPSEVYTMQVSTSFIKGKHTITAIADADNRIDEFSETNNCAQYVIISR